MSNVHSMYLVLPQHSSVATGASQCRLTDCYCCACCISIRLVSLSQVLAFMPHHVLHVLTVSLMFCQDDKAMRMRKRTTSEEDLLDMPGELLPF